MCASFRSLWLTKVKSKLKLDTFTPRVTCLKQDVCFLTDLDHARQISKSMMRKQLVDRLAAGQDEDIDNFCQLVTKDSIQKSLGLYMESLKKKADKKS